MTGEKGKELARIPLIGFDGESREAARCGQVGQPLAAKLKHILGRDDEQFGFGHGPRLHGHG